MSFLHKVERSEKDEANFDKNSDVDEDYVQLSKSEKCKKCCAGGVHYTLMF